MANTLTAIIPTVLAAMQAVERENAVLPSLVDTSFGPERVAVNQDITFGISAAQAAYDVTPGAVPPALVDTTLTSSSIKITKSRASRFHMTGEDFKRAASQGPDFRARQIEEAVRTLANEVHADIADVGAAGASGAVGTAGTDPFGSNLDILEDAGKLLFDDLTPISERRLLIDSGARSNLGKRGELTKVNESGTDQLLREGFIGRLKGFDIAVGNYVARPTKGTGASYVVNGAIAAGATSIPVITGSGTVLAGDVVSFANDTSGGLYVVGTGIAAPGTIVLVGGVLSAFTGGAMTVQNTARRNLAFHRSAIGLVARPPALPEGGDMAVEEAIVSDPNSGLSMRLAKYKGYHAEWYELGLAWGVKVMRAKRIKQILGK